MRHAISLSVFSFLLLNTSSYGTTAIALADSLAQQEQAQPSKPQPTAPQPSEPTPSVLISPEPGGPPETGETGTTTTGTTGTTATGSTGSTSETTTAGGYADTGYAEGTSASLPSTGPDFDVRIACGEVRDIEWTFNILSVKSRFFTRHYVASPELIESAPDLEVGDHVMISYVISHGIRFAIKITAHD